VRPVRPQFLRRSQNEKPSDEEQAKTKKEARRDDEGEPELQPKAAKAAPPATDSKDDDTVMDIALTSDHPIPVSRSETHWLDEDLFAHLAVGTIVTRRHCHDHAKVEGAQMWRCQVSFKQGGKEMTGWVHGSAAGKPAVLPP
jgi:hypothetical protein